MTTRHDDRPPVDGGARATARPTETLLLVAHGSRSTAGQAEMTELARAVSAASPGTSVHLGYLELCDPPAAEVLDELAATGAEVVVVPMMLHAAGHTKSDVPAVVLRARSRRPGARISYARPLGVDHGLLALARRRLAEAGALGLPLAMQSRGTSDPDANGEAYKVARLLADMSGTSLVVPGFSGVTWPSVRESLEQLRRLGAARIAAFAWFLATGLLIDRMRQQFESFASESGIEVVDAGYLGVGAELVDVVLERAREAAAGPVAVNCDACAYRKPFPGVEDRVGAAMGVGHSHLAAEHLQAHGHGVGDEHRDCDGDRHGRAEPSRHADRGAACGRPADGRPRAVPGAP